MAKYRIVVAVERHGLIHQHQLTTQFWERVAPPRTRDIQATYS